MSMELLDENVIRVNRSSVGAPILFAKKLEGGPRFYINYRGLYAITEKNRYPLLLNKEPLWSMSEAK